MARPPSRPRRAGGRDERAPSPHGAKKSSAARSTASSKADAAPRAGAVTREFTIFDMGRAGDAGATSHYEDPDYYTVTYRDRRHDVAYYAQKARLSGGPVLEYGVGNGRIGLHIARAGVELDGVDMSEPMLADFERRIGNEPPQVRKRIRLHQGDMRELRLERRFPLVIAPFNVLLHLYDRRDVEAFLARVREHLTDDGYFMFDFSVPQPADLARDADRAYPAPDLRDPETGEVVSYAERFEYDPLRQLLLVRLDFTPASNRGAFTVPLTHRQYFPREVEALLHYNGFQEILFTADFTDLPADRYVDSMVVRCKKTS